AETLAHIHLTASLVLRRGLGPERVPDECRGTRSGSPRCACRQVCFGSARRTGCGRRGSTRPYPSRSSSRGSRRGSPRLSDSLTHDSVLFKDPFYARSCRGPQARLRYAWTVASVDDLAQRAGCITCP